MFQTIQGRMSRVGIALLLGIVSFVLVMNIAEANAEVGIATLAGWFFASQLLLSRGNPNAHRTDWTIMLALDGAWLLAMVAMVFAERLAVIITQGPVILVCVCGGTYAGAYVASVLARRKNRQKVT